MDFLLFAGVACWWWPSHGERTLVKGLCRCCGGCLKTVARVTGGVSGSSRVIFLSICGLRSGFQIEFWWLWRGLWVMLGFLTVVVLEVCLEIGEACLSLLAFLPFSVLVLVGLLLHHGASIPPNLQRLLASGGLE